MNLWARITYKLIGRYLKYGEYVDTIVSKNAIVLHFTAGYGEAKATGDWFDQQPGKIATAYSCGKDGVIAELFPPAYWAWHLGSTDANEMRTIGIEISNIGPLWAKGGLLFDCYNKPYHGPYITLKTPFRGVYHWSTFTPEQYESVGKWAAERCMAFNIPPVVNRSLEYNYNNGKLVGICTHTNFRLDKFDIGPAWDWDRFESIFRAEYERLKAGK